MGKNTYAFTEKGKDAIEKALKNKEFFPLFDMVTVNLGLECGLVFGKIFSSHQDLSINEKIVYRFTLEVVASELKIPKMTIQKCVKKLDKAGFFSPIPNDEKGGELVYQDGGLIDYYTEFLFSKTNIPLR